MENNAHIAQRRLTEIARNNTRLAEQELTHMEGCGVCVELFSKVILEVARSRAREKKQTEKA
jgi:hypothetical protein